MSYVEKLKHNPIFAMSLSSKELFHSNFWAWLFERDMEYTKIFFEDIKNTVGIEREQGHRDVTVWEEVNFSQEKNMAYVVENKFKSLPYKAQLLEYQGKLGDTFAGGVVTGIIEPDFLNDSEMDKWRFLSYLEIGEKIREVAERIETEAFEKQLIMQYGEMLIQLYQLLICELEKNDNVWGLGSRECSELRIGDIYSKLFAAKLVKYLKGNLQAWKTERRIGDYDLTVEQYYGTGGAGVDVRYVQTSDKNRISVLGIQIQGSQYRWCAQKNVRMEPYSEAMDAFFDEYKKKGWFVDYDHLSFPAGSDKVIRDHISGEMRSTSMGTVKRKKGKSSPYRLYAADWVFMYQYWHVDGFHFEEILRIIERDMELAKRLLIEG